MRQSLTVKRSLYNFVYGQESVESSQDYEEHMVSSLLLDQVRDYIDIPGTIRSAFYKTGTIYEDHGAERA